VLIKVFKVSSAAFNIYKASSAGGDAEPLAAVGSAAVEEEDAAGDGTGYLYIVVFKLY
jgi:hypothetical protein